ncbi:hypothetical protein ACOWPH_26805 [Anabaena sp. PCC 7938]|uniref:Uncharacterized protein n=1 Tax=Anabaena cylindrica (strain ATCC 27899 / PCC 7122) TaxID=272123 RepID=K9ZCQ5_ANACC|nr:hypothetical protein Anacy_0928 [Anabaena cylindrica PCC 7122]BAY01049.1 hypothetical protein NIES19_02790 [Anabaena cylindrica PCC 7122]
MHYIVTYTESLFTLSVKTLYDRVILLTYRSLKVTQYVELYQNGDRLN